jgi:hypothetical protein
VLRICRDDDLSTHSLCECMQPVEKSTEIFLAIEMCQKNIVAACKIWGGGSISGSRYDCACSRKHTAMYISGETRAGESYCSCHAAHSVAE